MTSVNVATVINILATTLQIVSLTPVTPFEIEVHDIRNTLQNFQNVRSISLFIFIIKHDYILDFADPSESHRVTGVLVYLPTKILIFNV